MPKNIGDIAKKWIFWCQSNKISVHSCFGVKLWENKRWRTGKNISPSTWEKLSFEAEGTLIFKEEKYGSMVM